MAKVEFIFKGIPTTIQCFKEDKMKDICRKFVSKINVDINSLFFLYGGKTINMDLSFNQISNSIDNSNKKMNILVYQNENEILICPKCGAKIKFDTKLIDDISSSNNDIEDILNGLKIQVENVINDILNQKSTNYIKSQLKNINIIINNVNLEIKKNNEKINKLTIFNQNNCNSSISINSKNSIIEGILDIKLKEIGNGVVLFNRKNKDGMDIYLNDKKINMKNEKDKWIIDYDFKKDGKFNFKIIFNHAINNLGRFFLNCSNLYSVDLSNFDTSNVIDMNRMFSGCTKLREIKGINKLNTSNVISMSVMFQLCKELEYLDLSNFDTSNVTNMEFMFNMCYKLKEIKGLNKINTKSVDRMVSMFSSCQELEYLDLSNFDTSNVVFMDSMFSRCNKLREIKGINKFNTNKVQTMKGMFELCENLEFLDLSNFDTSEVTNMRYMFNMCYKLKEIKGLNKFNTNSVDNMESMFKNCKELEFLDLSNFDTSNVNDINAMFGGCNKLREIKGINNFNTRKVKDMSQMFRECKELKYLDLSNFDTTYLVDMRCMFYDCINLKYLNILKFNVNNIAGEIFFSVPKECNLITDNQKLKNIFKYND